MGPLVTNDWQNVGIIEKKKKYENFFEENFLVFFKTQNVIHDLKRCFVVIASIDVTYLAVLVSSVEKVISFWLANLEMASLSFSIFTLRFTGLRTVITFCVVDPYFHFFAEQFLFQIFRQYLKKNTYIISFWKLGRSRYNEITSLMVLAFYHRICWKSTCYSKIGFVITIFNVLILQIPLNTSIISGKSYFEIGIHYCWARFFLY